MKRLIKAIVWLTAIYVMYKVLTSVRQHECAIVHLEKRKAVELEKQHRTVLFLRP